MRESSRSDDDPTTLSRALLILLHVTKELATARLRRSQQSLQAATPEIIRVLGRIYVDKVQAWQTGLQAEDAANPMALVSAMEQSLLAIKVLRRLFVFGYEFPNRDDDVHEFWQLTFGQVRDFIGAVSQQSSALLPYMTRLVEKHLLQLAKLHLEMARTHPAAFVLLPNSLELVGAYWGLVKQFGQEFGACAVTDTASATVGTDGDQSDDAPAIEKLSLRGIQLIRACVKMVFNPTQTFKYRHEQEKEEQAQAKSTIKDGLLTQAFVQELMEITVTKFFVFRQSDLREWEEEPEEWEAKEEGESEGFEFAVRPAAEKLFLELAIHFKELIVQPLLQVFASVATVDNDDVLFKDSVYTAIGLSAAVIHQDLDFNAFLSSTLVAEVQKQKPGFNILRRRIAILLGQWITIKVSDENRPLVYQIFQHLLEPQDPLNDQVVRVTAGRQFKNIADAWEFDAKQFMPFAETTMTRLMQLIQEVELTETKLALLNTISVVVERLEHHVSGSYLRMRCMLKQPGVFH